jgi:hypothetical protein
MRVSPAIRVKGVSRVKCQGSANPNDRGLRNTQKRAGSMPCTFGTLIYPEPETSVSTSRTWSGLSSNDGRGSNLLPARSDSPDLIDGARMAGDIAPWAIFGKLEMPDLRALKADRD